MNRQRQHKTGTVRVLLVSPLPPPSGGIGRWTLLLLEWLIARPEVSVSLVDIGVRWRAMWDLTLWKRIVGGVVQGVWDATRVLAQIAAFRPQVLHLNSSAQLRGPWDTGVLAAAAVFGIKAFYHLRMGRLPEIMERKGWEWWGLRWALKLAYRVVVLDQRSEAALKLFLPAERVLRLPNAIPGPLLGLPATAPQLPTVFYAAHVVPAKGAHELLAAWRELRPQGWCLHLAGLGDASYKRELLEMVGPDAGVDFLGDLPHQEVLQRMREAEIFVLPTYTEGFPNVILEAMAAGKAIISTRVGAIPEMLEADSEQPCGLVIEPRNAGALVDALRTLLTDSELRSTLGQRASARLGRCYTVDVVFSRLLMAWKAAVRPRLSAAEQCTRPVVH